MKKIIMIAIFMVVIITMGCDNNSLNDGNNQPSTIVSNNEDQNDTQLDIFSGPGEDYLLEGKEKNIKPFREYGNWYEVEYSNNKRGYVSKDLIQDINNDSVELVVKKLTIGPTERKEIVALDADYTLTGDIKLHDAPVDNSDIIAEVKKSETVKIVNMEPVKKKAAGLDSVEANRYWQVEAKSFQGRLRGYVKSTDLFDYYNPLRNFDSVKSCNAKIEYDNKVYYSDAGAIMDGYLDNWRLEESINIKKEKWDIFGGIVNVIGHNYDPEDILVSKSVEMPSVSKGKKNYYQTSENVDTTREIPYELLGLANVFIDWVPSFLGGAYSSFDLNIELHEYEGERRIIMRTGSPIELQNNEKYTGKTFDLYSMYIDAQGSTGNVWGRVDDMIRKAYPNFNGNKLYSMKITFADEAECAKNPYGHYIIIDKDLNVYTQLIIHAGTQAIIYYDNKPFYDATSDLASLQKVDDDSAAKIIELLQEKGFSFITTDNISGKEKHPNAEPESLVINENDRNNELKSREQIDALLNDYVNNKEFMYGKTCDHIIEGLENAYWDGIISSANLGYDIEDFDDDGSNELLIVRLTDEYELQLDMYEVVEGEIKLSDSILLDTNNSYYSAMNFPDGEAGKKDESCGLLSCLIHETNHRIFIQSTSIYDGMGYQGGSTASIVSVIYGDGSFLDYKISSDDDISGEEFSDEYYDDFRKINKRLLGMGVDNPDFESILYDLKPLTECFDEGVREFIHADQKTISIENVDDWRKSKSVTRTYFKDVDGLVAK